MANNITIPVKLLSDPSLTAAQIVLLGVVGMPGMTRASNQEFADLLHTRPECISRRLHALARQGFVQVIHKGNKFDDARSVYLTEKALASV